MKRLLLAALLALALTSPAIAAWDMDDITCETTASEGTGTVDLGGALSGGYLPLATTVANGSTVPYHIIQGSGASRKIEVGMGVFTDASPDTLTRVATWSSDGAGAELDLVAGTKSVCVGFVTTTFVGDKGDITVGPGFETLNIDADAVGAAEIAAGAVGTSEAAALDAGDVTTGTFADALVAGSAEVDEVLNSDLGDFTCAAGSCTIDANSVALTTDTTGNYAAGDAEAGSALSGDSATAFFSTGTIEDARIDGSAEVDEVLNSDLTDFTCVAGVCNLDADVVGAGEFDSASAEAEIESVIDTLDNLTNIGSADSPTKGDLLVGDGSAWDDLAIGADDLCLVSDSGETLGMKWATCVAGTGDNLGDHTATEDLLMNDWHIRFDADRGINTSADAALVRFGDTSVDAADHSASVVIYGTGEDFPDGWDNNLVLQATNYPALYFRGDNGVGVVYAFDSLSKIFWLEEVSDSGGGAFDRLKWDFENQQFFAEDASWDLGQSTNPWTDLYLSNTINFGAGDVLVTYTANDLAFTGVTGDYSFDDTVGVTGSVTASVDVTATAGDVTSGDDVISGDDVLLSDNGVVNFNAGDCTLTEGGALTVAGCTLTATITDGDQGDISVSSGLWEIDVDTVTPTELAEAGNYSFTGTVTLDGDALHIFDTNASHDLIITPGSDLSADRVLTVTTGDAARTLTLTDDVSLGDADKGDITVSSDFTAFAIDANVVQAAEIDETDTYAWSGNSTVTGSLTFDSDAVHIFDTNASHDLIITPGSDLSADRVFTITTGDAARTLTLSANATLNDADYGDITTSSSFTAWNIDADVVGPTELAEAGSYAFTGDVTFDSDALHIFDTNASHDLIITPGSDLSADRVLTLTTGDAARTVTISGNATISQDYSSTGSPTFAAPTVTTLELGAAATDATFARTGAGEATLEGDAIKHAGKQMFWVGAGAMKPSALNPVTSCGGAYDSGTQDVSIYVCDFDPGATEENAEFGFPMPKASNESTITMQFAWTNTGGASTETVQFKVACTGFGDDDALNTAYPADVTVSDTWTAQNDYQLTAETGAITIQNLAENDWVNCRIGRDTSVDNMAGDLLLIGAKVYWTDNASTLAE